MIVIESKSNEVNPTETFTPDNTHPEVKSRALTALTALTGLGGLNLPGSANKHPPPLLTSPHKNQTTTRNYNIIKLTQSVFVEQAWSNYGTS